MLKFLVLRLALAVLTLMAVSVAVFWLAHATGSPVDVILPNSASLAMRQATIERLGLDQPLPIQYLTFLRNALSGDFGNSIRTGAPAMAMVAPRILPSVLLASTAIGFAVSISLPLGILAATHRDQTWDRISMGIASLGQAIPSFLAGILAILIFSVLLGWLPAQGASSWQNYILPAVTMGWWISAGITRLLRSSMLDVLDSEYVKFARSKGLSERAVIWKHALRNALIPVVTFIGFMYGSIIAAAIATETVFGWPGMGRLAYEAVIYRDFPVMQAVVLIWAAMIIGLNLIVDGAYGLLDPRIGRS